MSSRRSMRRARRAASPVAQPTLRLTRRTALQGPAAELLGRPMMCPISYCNTQVPPSFAPDGTVEYRCYVGRHGQIGRVVNGRVELTVRTFVSPQRRMVPNRPKCVDPDCSLVRNATCGRRSCLQHCLQKQGSCTGYAHDYARARERMLGHRRLESVEVDPSTPLFFPSTPTPERSPPPCCGQPATALSESLRVEHHPQPTLTQPHPSP